MIEYENLGRLNTPFFKEFEVAFKQVLESGWYVLGKNVAKFESSFAKYLQADYCTGVANGLDALVLALDALRLNVGDEVIVPANTYIASILAIVRLGLKPVLVEPCIRSYNIDPDKIAASITPRTKAILVVHLYGKSCDMDPILDICSKHDLRLVEDCAQSHGATYKGKMTGTFGDFGCFSFYPTKNLGALGDAGAVISSNQALDNTIRKLRNYGSVQKYHNELAGYNSRLDEVQAAFLNIKLQSLDAINTHKKALAQIYFSLLDDAFIKPIRSAGYEDVFHIFNIRHAQRDQLKAYLFENGVGTEIHYPIPPVDQVAMKGIIHGNFPISEEIHKTTLSLPISFFHTVEDIRFVCEVANRFVAENR
ncbi:aminotransferase class I/II-fold pyridoxal phosphate-dependent enzyme [Pseudomonas sp. Fl5BN2]|uniref:DegT/DnrJ/EryC1/StrS family aminotransferase n=1 Tax=Pseudomonas sp. Fl5BN2 TaxID=2697652 RepID=UPI00137743E3|nr:DegT/DnrJ/EryC1/StrS family aminotransferase [Pseudomonas sp. Fl5BN2]NBF03294.1 aminotransferase class I/II-fold pyridoxal phosphate-dependent enzyme [Pseudomonas sp. Fl5BN2]